MVDTEKLHASPYNLVRTSENGDGVVSWCYSTNHALDDVLVEGYFDRVGRHGLRRLDRIHVNCDVDTDEPVIADVVVTGVIAGAASVVLREGSVQTVECVARSCFELLGILPNASETDIQAAYRERSKKYHPDTKGGGNAEKFRLLTKARDDALVIVAHQGTQAAA